ncbi:Nitroreductase [Pseudorhodobacter antarcticus]|jgi:nitroreductase|uniref:Putative NAD(P)H nitroreductase n=1 Tax=Pseudorhodobacter antarcticus TaxID=1077947 RepID=A0A1H8LZ15_9RHOB|nr:nitroreductase [Pseudorhodobacter antarcticus]SEO10382.1 Nitroreductase [Pseudorhodobacter antarcticus]
MPDTPHPTPQTAAQTATDFLQTRRSVPAKTLALPVPDAAALHPILTAAARVPDHGKLEPWRFLVLHQGAMPRLAALARTRAAALGLDAERTLKGAAQYDAGHLAVVVIAAPKPSDKVPQIEQILSAGAVCVSLVNAALAAGWGANWLSGWPSHDRAFVETGFGLAPHETVAGIIHIGTITTPTSDRPRPDVAALTTWANE